MDMLINNSQEIDTTQITTSSEQVINGATDTVKTISDYFGIDTLFIWLAALIIIILVWRIFRKLGKVVLALIIIAIIVAAVAGTFFL